MHYVITYDIEDDRLRNRTAKTLQRFGCIRIQKSVFVAAHMEKRHWTQMRASLNRLLASRLKPGESLLIIPLRDEHVSEISAIGHNNVFAALEDPPLKTVL